MTAPAPDTVPDAFAAVVTERPDAPAVSGPGGCLTFAQLEARAFALVEEMNREESGGEVVETHVGRPSEERARRKEDLRELLDRPRTAVRLREAEELYGRYVTLANRVRG